MDVAGAASLGVGAIAHDRADREFAIANCERYYRAADQTRKPAQGVALYERDLNWITISV